MALLITPLAFLVGYVLQRFLLQRTVGKGILPILLVTFGLSIIIQNGLLEAYGPNTRKLSGGAIELASFSVGPVDIGLYPLLVFLLAVAAIAGLDVFLYRTSIGARIRAVSDDPAAADLIGLTSARIYPVAMGIVGITMLAAACCMSVWTNFDPAIGPSRLLAAFEAVVLGGLGSLWGTLAGGDHHRHRAELWFADRRLLADPRAAPRLPRGPRLAAAGPVLEELSRWRAAAKTDR